MTIARYAARALATASFAATAQAQAGPSPITAPIIRLEPLQLSDAELRLINDACRIEHAYRNDRDRLLAFRRQAVREGDDTRRATIDRLGRELDTWRKASIEHLWIQLSFPGRRQLREQMEAGCAPATESDAATTAATAGKPRQVLATAPADFKGTIAIPHAQMDRELDYLRRVMNRRAAMLEAMFPETDEPADSKFVERRGSSVTITMPEESGGSKKAPGAHAPGAQRASARPR
jgi:hypothetical protein